jgi:uncharacterized Zn-finger protein
MSIGNHPYSLLNINLFQLKKYLTNHMRVHVSFVLIVKIYIERKNDHFLQTGERPFPCTICGNNYKHFSDLQRHKLVHSGIRPFKCSFEGCEKTFPKKTSVTNHERTHTVS